MFHKLKQQFHSLVVTHGAYAEYIKELNDKHADCLYCMQI